MIEYYFHALSNMNSIDAIGCIIGIVLGIYVMLLFIWMGACLYRGDAWPFTIED